MIFVRNKPINLKPEHSIYFENEYEYDNKSIEVLKHNDVFICPEQIFYKGIKRITKINTRQPHDFNLKFLWSFIKRKKIKISKCIWVSDLWSNNYFHWFTEVVPKLVLVELKYQDHTLILPNDLKNCPYISASVNVFKNIKIQWQKKYEIIKATEFVYIPNLAQSGNYDEPIIREVRNRIRSHYTLQNDENRTAISRQGCNTRNWINYDEVLNILNRYNFQTIEFENLSWLEQIQFISKSNILLGTHGAGLTNMLFMKEGSAVIELRRKDDKHNNCYFSLASALKLKYYYIMCDVDDINKLTQQNNFLVDTIELNNLLNSIIK